MKTTHTKLAARAAVYCVGLLVLSFGIALAVNSNLGVSPVSSLPYVVSQILNISLGRYDYHRSAGRPADGFLPQVHWPRYPADLLRLAKK